MDRNLEIILVLPKDLGPRQMTMTYIADLSSMLGENVHMAKDEEMSMFVLTSCVTLAPL